MLIPSQYSLPCGFESLHVAANHPNVCSAVFPVVNVCSAVFPVVNVCGAVFLWLMFAVLYSRWLEPSDTMLLANTRVGFTRGCF